MIRKIMYFFMAVLYVISVGAWRSPDGINLDVDCVSEGKSQSILDNGLRLQDDIEGSSSTDTWLIMLYQNADDEILEQDIFIDLNEAELIGSSDQITIVSQMDRYDGAFDGDGDWTGAKRFLVSQDDDLETINSEEIEDLGEVDSGDKDTLIEFATWAIESYPANKYVLILSDHGAGWTGGWNDSDPVEESQFTTNDIDLALALIIDQTGIDGFELVGFDACLMSHLEDLSAVAPYARYAVASEETEPSLGWAYAAFLSELEENPAMDGGELASIIVDAYISQDVRIVDDDARVVYLEEMGYEEDDITQEIFEDEMSSDVTLTAIDLSKLIDIDQAVSDFVVTLLDFDQAEIAKARSYAQSFESVFGEEDPSPFIDLLNFANLVKNNLQDDAISEAVDQLSSAVDEAVLNEKHGKDKPGASGFALFFPTSNLVQETYEDYANTATRFAKATLWDDFLLYHYTGEKIDITAADIDLMKPQYGGSEVEVAQFESIDVPQFESFEAPGSGEVGLTPITLSEEEISLGESVVLSTTVSGKNIGYIYIYTEYFDEDSDSYITVDTDYVDIGETREYGGVLYPDWGDDETFDLEVEWSPVIYFITDGVDEVFAGAEPEIFGKSAKDTIYQVWGTYTFTASSQSRAAVMYFNGEGVMQNIFGFVDENGTGAPREITPGKGDQFTVEEEWYVFEGDDPEGEFQYFDGGTLTFGSQRFKMISDDTLAGEYVVGIVIENLDGQTYEEFAEVSVFE